jgi:hypothetical protein
MINEGTAYGTALNPALRAAPAQPGLPGGTAYGTALAVKHILALLEQRGVVAHGEVVKALDSALDELNGLKGVMAPDASAAAARTISLLYLR